MSKAIEDSIFTWNDLLETTIDNLSFGRCTFLKDFGPWTKGQECDNLAFDFERSKLLQFDAEGEVIEFCFIELVARGEKS